MTPTTDAILTPPRHTPPSCSTALMALPLADLADALAARLGCLVVDIDPRDRYRLRRLKGTLDKRVGVPIMPVISDAILPPKASGTTPQEQP